MVNRFISRRLASSRDSVTGGLAVGLGLGAEPLNESAPAMPPGPGGLTLTVIGDAEQSYGVTLLFNGQPVVRHNQGGEFSAVFKMRNAAWKTVLTTGKRPRGRGTPTVTLDGECKLKI